MIHTRSLQMTAQSGAPPFSSSFLGLSSYSSTNSNSPSGQGVARQCSYSERRNDLPSRSGFDLQFQRGHGPPRIRRSATVEAPPRVRPSIAAAALPSTRTRSRSRCLHPAATLYPNRRRSHRVKEDVRSFRWSSGRQERWPAGDQRSTTARPSLRRAPHSRRRRRSGFPAAPTSC